VALAVSRPSDAAPANLQTRIVDWNSTGTTAKCLDFYESVYGRVGTNIADLFNIPLVRLDKDFQTIPGAASKWTSTPDAKTWTFFIDPGQMWTDGNEVTAADYIETFRYSADPKHAWDFTWYWSGKIKNYLEATKGSVPPNQIGVRQGADKYQFVVDCEVPVPYMPSQMLYSMPLSAAGLMKYGTGLYNTNPGTSISFGPYVLTKFDPLSQFVVTANPKYSRSDKPFYTKVICNVVGDNNEFQRYQANEIDTVASVSPTDLKQVLASPDLTKQLYKNPQDFRCYYLFFDVTVPPWNNLKVRQAFSHAVDRDSIIKAILQPLALPAYSFLMPGYPDANSQGLSGIQNYDPTAAKQALADAGFPGGKGFPAVTLFVRGSGPVTDAAVTQALAANFNQVLGVKVQLQNIDSPTFMSRLTGKPSKIPFGWISYGMDYFDSSNMLGVWLQPGGRHTWDNAQYNQLVTTGSELAGDPAKRTQTMQAAEKLLVSDVPAVFVYHSLIGQLFKPFLKGAPLAADKFGYTGEEWPGFASMTQLPEQEYNTTDVTKYHKS
jgi:ABC-type transport system substrate-binding protein